MTTVNIGNAKTATDVATHFNLDQELSNASYAVRVANTVSALKLQIESYTAPTGVTTANPFLYYAEKATGGSTGPAPTLADGGGAAGPDDGPSDPARRRRRHAAQRDADRQQLDGHARRVPHGGRARHVQVRTSSTPA